MVILGSLNYSLYQEPTISRFLPVRVTGMKRISFLPGLGQSDRKNDQSHPLPMYGRKRRRLSGERCWRKRRVCRCLSNPVEGKGRVTYLSLDVGRPPLSQWDGLPRFLQNLLTPGEGEDLALGRVG